MRLLAERPLRPGAASVRHSDFSASLALPREVQRLLRCPKCRDRLRWQQENLVCTHPLCGARYPAVDGVPVLIDDDQSVFTRDDFIARRNTTFNLSRPRLKERLDLVLPKLGRNLKARENYRFLATRLHDLSEDPVVLVIGGSVLGQGIDELVSRPGMKCVETDVALGPRTQVICDAHSLPFRDGSFDAVVVQAVLQYVADPLRCVEEIKRVLKPDGLVYAETAFMQQVVHGRYDFTRFTHLGIRRLFRGFRELRSGPVAGPGMALAWAGHFFLLSFVSRRFTRSLVHAVARLTLFWLKYFDSILLGRPGVYDAASGFFFLGMRCEQTLSDREVVKLYRGAQR